MACRRRPDRTACWDKQEGRSQRVTPTGVLLGENQAIRGIERQGMRLRIVGQQAGIDCDAAAKAVAAPVAPTLADVEPADTVLRTSSERKPWRIESAENGRLSMQLAVVPESKL